LFPVVLLPAVHWYVAGALMSGESGQLSPRVRRTLPQSFVGRTLRTWFNPGAGTGYVFVVLNLWALAIFVIGAAVIGEMLGHGGGSQIEEIISVAAMTAAYVTAYLGVGRLIVLFWCCWPSEHSRRWSLVDGWKGSVNWTIALSK
jgi:hypothetical protein